MSLTDYKKKYKNLFYLQNCLSVISNVVHVMLFRCTIGISDWEKKSLFISLEHLASLNDLSQDAGCVYIIINSQWINKHRVLICERKICVECVSSVDDRIIKQFHLIWQRKSFIIFTKAGKLYLLCVGISSLEIILLHFFSGTLEREKIQNFYIVFSSHDRIFEIKANKFIFAK